MFDTRTIETRLSQNSKYPENSDHLLSRQAISLHHIALRKGVVARWIARLTGHARSLLDLDALQPGLNVRGRHYAGVQAVSIEHILGSESRSSDFDSSFSPLNEKTSSRWLSIATARLQGTAMPAIELIQIGEAYFVRDGHHRISVARAFGEEAIDAQVTVWDVAGMLPWEKSTDMTGLCAEAI